MKTKIIDTIYHEFHLLEKEDVYLITDKNDELEPRLKELGYVKSDMKSSLNKEKIYSPYDVDIWAIEKNKCREEIEACMNYKGNITYALCDKKDLDVLIHKISDIGKYWSYEDILESQVLSGFEYLGGYERNSTKFILAMIGEHIIGACAYEDYPKQYMTYIDVHIAYRGRGIGTSLLKMLGTIIDKEKTLYVTEESDIGKQCGVHNKIHTYCKCPILIKN